MRRRATRGPADFYARLPTEQAHPLSADLDRLSPAILLRRLNDIHGEVQAAVRSALPALGRLVEMGRRALGGGGRIFFVGAGTSGRLGAMESAECPPTFGTAPRQVRALIAGGARALRRSVEGAEDDPRSGAAALRRARVGRRDLAVGLTASGVTPYVAGALAAAARAGAQTALMTCNAHARLSPAPGLTVVLRTGPEALAGSTRLKAGTATKIALNLFTTAVAVRLGRVHGNRMVDVRSMSRKLVQRARRLVRDLTGLSEAGSAALLRRTKGDVKLAVVCGAKRLPPRAGRALLRKAGGNLRTVLAQ